MSLVELESVFDTKIITQNIDDLHERAGSSNVTHLHGELTKARSSNIDGHVAHIGFKDIKIGDRANDGSQLRPHIVWFGEQVPMMDLATEIMLRAEILLVIGTSLNVYPAAGLVQIATPNCRKIIVDPKAVEISTSGFEAVSLTAVQGIPKIVADIKA